MEERIKNSTDDRIRFRSTNQAILSWNDRALASDLAIPSTARNDEMLNSVALEAPRKAVEGHGDYLPPNRASTDLQIGDPLAPLPTSVYGLYRMRREDILLFLHNSGTDIRDGRTSHTPGSPQNVGPVYQWLVNCLVVNKGHSKSLVCATRATFYVDMAGKTEFLLGRSVTNLRVRCLGHLIGAAALLMVGERAGHFRI